MKEMAHPGAGLSQAFDPLAPRGMGSDRGTPGELPGLPSRNSSEPLRAGYLCAIFQEITMPILMQCGQCQTKCNVPDSAAGRKVKCPKCAQVFSVPAQAATVRAPQAPPSRPAAQAPAATGPARAAVKAPPAPKAAGKKLPLLSLDDLKVPGRLRKKVTKELGDEKPVWMGRPAPGALLSQAKIGMIVGLVLMVPGLGGLGYGVMQMLEKPIPWLNVALWGGIGAIVLLFFALPLATMPIWVKILINFRDCYVLTAKRAIVFNNEAILFAKVLSYGPEKLHQRTLHLDKKAEGRGSIVMGYVEVKTSGTMQIRSKTYKGPGRTIKETTMKRVGDSVAHKPVGFMDVDDVLHVENLLRATLKLPPANREE
jgi:predicted Zn finger-like uncharacterized protein